LLFSWIWGYFVEVGETLFFFVDIGQFFKEAHRHLNDINAYGWGNFFYVEIFSMNLWYLYVYDGG
jgi:hypothetical protein